MGFLESIGGLVLIAGFVFIIYNIDQKAANINPEKDRLAPHSPKCRELTREYNRAALNNSPIMTHHEYRKRLHKILDNPNEKKIAYDSIREKEKNEASRKDKILETRKLGFIHQNNIFCVFDTKRELSEEELINRMMIELNISQAQSNTLLIEWKSNMLIRKCHWNKDKYEIDNILTSRFMQESPSDLIQSDWLDRHKKVLEETSNEYNNFMNG